MTVPPFLRYAVLCLKILFKNNTTYRRAKNALWYAEKTVI